MDTDERYAASLLRPLARAPRTPTTVDIARAVVEGERRQRRVRLAGSGAVAAATALVLVGAWAAVGRPDRPDQIATVPSTPAPAPTTAAPTSSPVPSSCTVRRLPLPPGAAPKSIVSGADPSGRYILGRYYPDGKFRYPMVIWDRLHPIQITIPGDDQNLHDITSTGIAVGTSYIGGKTAAWVYQDGKVTRLAGGVAFAKAINERGTIVGSVNEKPAMWASPTSQPVFLAQPSPDWTGYAIDIDEDGAIVGRMVSSNAEFGYVWRPDGSVQQLAVPTVQGGPATMYTARSMRNGWVAGWAARDIDRFRHIVSPRWNLRTGEVETDSMREPAMAINRHGWRVGGYGRPVLVADGTRVELPSLSEPTTNASPVTVSDDGTTIAGQANVEATTPVAVVWTCR